MNKLAFIVGDMLYRHAYPLYLPLYSLYKRISDKDERRYVRGVMRASGSVVDVGASIGAYARFFAHLVGLEGHVYAFEPSPENYARLSANVRHLGNVTAVQAAVGDRSGTTGLYLSEVLNVDHQTYDAGSGRRRIDVPLVRLDDYFPSGTKIDFIKIDVQGYEYNVLKGATRILADNPDIKLLIEYWPYGLARSGIRPESLLEFIKSIGFDFAQIGQAANDEQELQDADAGQEGKYWNLAVRKAALQDP